MQPMIANPTFNALLQVLIAIGTVASILSPFVGNGKLFTALHYISAAGLDIAKVFKGPPALPDARPEVQADPNQPTLPGVK